MTDEIQLLIGKLWKLLPPVTRSKGKLDPRTLIYLLREQETMTACDLEWDEKTGELTQIGIGDLTEVHLIDWSSLDCQTRREMIEVLWPTVAARRALVFHNAIGDLKKLWQNGFCIRARDYKRIEDTMLLHAVLHSEEEHSLEYLIDKLGSLPQHKHLRVVPEAADVYNPADVVETAAIWGKLYKQAQQDERAWWIYRNFSIGFIDIVIEGELAGIQIDRPLAAQLMVEYNEKIEQARKLALIGSGMGIAELNVASPKQLNWWAYEVLGLPPVYTTDPRGNRTGTTLDRDALAKCRRFLGVDVDPREVPTLETAIAHVVEEGSDPVLEARYLFLGAQQATSHYIKPCLASADGRIYPECRTHVQASGRHSYVSPALPQFKGKIEEMLIPDEGYEWLGHDWSNIETWILGAISGDELILQAKNANWDTHTLNYCDLAGRAWPAERTKKVHACTCSECLSWREHMAWEGSEDIRRTFAKMFVYRLHYRGDPARSGDVVGARRLGYTAESLVAAAEAYLSKHPAIVAYWETCDRAADNGIVYTFLGRPRRLTNTNPFARRREASNHAMQGAVADIYAATAIAIKDQFPHWRLVYGKYDSQWWQVPEGEAEQHRDAYRAIVEREYRINGRLVGFPGEYKIKRRVHG